ELRHEIDLLDADAVLAGDAAALRDALLEDLVARREDALHFLGVAFVEEHDGMEVAVAGVEDVADAQVVLLPDALDLAQHVRQFATRHDPVLRAITGSEPAAGPEGLLARLPEQEPLRLGLRLPHFSRVVLPGDGRDALGVRVESRFEAIDFHD